MPVYDQSPWRDVRFICTDRDQHPSREILIVSRDEQTGELSQTRSGQGASGRTVHRPDALGDPGPAKGRHQWDFPRCKTCGRAPDLSAEAMRLLVDGLLERFDTPRVTWDASHLP